MRCDRLSLLASIVHRPHSPWLILKWYHLTSSTLPDPTWRCHFLHIPTAMTITNDEQAAPDQKECLEKFMDTCLQKGLLARFESLELRDSFDGLLDQPTLLYVNSHLQSCGFTSLLTTNQTLFDRPKIRSRRGSEAFWGGTQVSWGKAPNQALRLGSNFRFREYPFDGECEFVQRSVAYLTYSQFFHWTGRRGKKGHPICFFDFDCLDRRALARWDTSRTTAYWNYSQTDTAPPNPHMLQLTRCS